MRNFQPDLEVGRESVLEHVDDMAERLHLLARHDYRVGERRMGRAGARTNLPPHGTVQRGASGERENRVEQGCHRSFISSLALSVTFLYYFVKLCAFTRSFVINFQFFQFTFKPSYRAVDVFHRPKQKVTSKSTKFGASREFTGILLIFTFGSSREL
jgi:hypothetical protein